MIISKTPISIPNTNGNTMFKCSGGGGGPVKKDYIQFKNESKNDNIILKNTDFTK